MASKGNKMLVVCACLVLALVCEPLCFVGGSIHGTTSRGSFARGSAMEETLDYESHPYFGDLEESSWMPYMSFMAAVMVGMMLAMSAPEASHARGQALQDLGARSVPGSMTWVERLRIEQASMGKAQEEAAVTEQRMKDAAISDPKEKRVADAMELMRALAKDELRPSKELPAYNQSFM
eukprot:TRINITY_DN6472_c0_g4_i2.p2 TRINITY_DN6472_c0_g4~~TRINITY_DN6472_c0_g4_i2.p2  ORF type:complete len:179 (+),score=54.25 TRINITY_DN6472_c0_g4_i2:105-641(+)